MNSQEYLKAAPKGTSKAQIEQIMKVNKGDRAKIEAEISKLYDSNNSLGENEWQHVENKSRKKKPEKSTASSYNSRQPRNGRRPASNGAKAPPAAPRPQQTIEKKVAPVPVPLPATSSGAKTSSWASLLKTKEVPKPAPAPVPAKQSLPKPKAPEKPKVEKPKPVEEPVIEEPKKEVPKAQPKITSVEEVEAEMKVALAKKEEEEKKVEVEKPKEPLVKPGFSLPKKWEKVTESKASEFANVQFGGSDNHLTLATLAKNIGKELVKVGTTYELTQLKRKLDDATQNLHGVKKENNSLDDQVKKLTEQNRQLAMRVDELQSSATEKDSLTEKVTQLTQQLEASNQRKLFEREQQNAPQKSPEKHDEISATQPTPPPSQPPHGLGQNQGPGYQNVPPQQAPPQNIHGMYPPPPQMGYYQNFYPAYNPNPNFNRNNVYGNNSMYDGPMHQMPPPGHQQAQPHHHHPSSGSPAQSQDNYPPGHEEFGRPPQGHHSGPGMGNMRQRSRDVMDKAPTPGQGQGQAPPGYGPNQSQQYGYNYMYPQQLGYNQGQHRGNQQGWGR